ncbi:hypothetical protein BKA70DRAFT_1076685, partial [Coprinopsis sp. MPI-PUGE-AT-0042]
MYHDKRFQLDPYFPMIAFNHEQIKSNVDGSFVVSKWGDFESVVHCLQTLNLEVLKTLAERMATGEHVKPSTPDESACFALLKDVDRVGAHADGFLTSKKHMKNEIWSLVANKGAPSWFVTFAPADNKHLLCLYFADTDTTFQPELVLPSDYRDYLVHSNPVAAARFFDVLVRLVMKHVFGFGSEETGFYGPPGAYYGTVEQ